MTRSPTEKDTIRRADIVSDQRVGLHFKGRPMIDVREIAMALGGQVAGPNTILAPGPGHSLRDRSLAVRLDPSAPDGFVCFSHAGDDWRDCRDHVRMKLGLPAWQPGDGRQRVIPPQHVKKWDLAAIQTELAERSRSCGARTSFPVLITHAAFGTKARSRAAQSSRNICATVASLLCQTNSLAGCCASILVVPGATKAQERPITSQR